MRCGPGGARGAQHIRPDAAAVLAGPAAARAGSRSSAPRHPLVRPRQARQGRQGPEHPRPQRPQRPVHQPGARQGGVQGDPEPDRREDRDDQPERLGLERLEQAALDGVGHRGGHPAGGTGLAEGHRPAAGGQAKLRVRPVPGGVGLEARGGDEHRQAGDRESGGGEALAGGGPRGAPPRRAHGGGRRHRRGRRVSQT
uniref:Uncharacterized protein n=1 Tax=Tolypothrix bouteillei VB521301 TaxID=1479485 RepID=A0A0C1R1U1_9CYAN